MENKINNDFIQDDNRRDFLKKSALFGASIFLSSCFSGPTFSSDLVKVNGSRISSVSFLDDCFRLACSSDEISIMFKKTLRANLHEHVAGNTARLGRIFPNGKQHIVHLIKAAKQGLEGDNSVQFADEKLALAIGILAADAWQTEMKTEDPNEEIGIYLDMAILKDMNGLDASAKIDGNVEELADLLHVMVPRFFTRVHTTIPDDDDAQGWILRVDKWRNDLNKYFLNLSAAYLNPDKQKVDTYIENSKLYDRSDKLIQQVRDIQISGLDSINISVVSSQKRSLYAKGLAKSYNAILAANDFFTGKLDESKFQEIIS